MSTFRYIPPSTEPVAAGYRFVASKLKGARLLFVYDILATMKVGNHSPKFNLILTPPPTIVGGLHAVSVPGDKQ